MVASTYILIVSLSSLFEQLMMRYNTEHSNDIYTL